MALIDESMPKKLQTISEREAEWVAAVLAQNPQVFECAVSGSHGDGARQRIYAALRSSAQPDRSADLMLNGMNRHVIPGNKIGWIDKKDQRLLIWLILRIHNLFHIPQWERPVISVSTDQVPTEIRYDHIINTLNLWPLNWKDKVERLADWKKEWAEQKLPASMTKWIDTSNEQQVAWAYSYLTDIAKVSIPIPPPINHKEKCDYILAALDSTSLLSPEAQELFFIKAKKAWSQYKYRHTGDAKKQTYMPLSDETKRMLDELAEKEGVAKYKIVETLILSAHKEAIRRQPD